MSLLAFKRLTVLAISISYLRATIFFLIKLVSTNIQGRGLKLKNDNGVTNYTVSVYMRFKRTNCFTAEHLNLFSLVRLLPGGTMYKTLA